MGDDEQDELRWQALRRPTPDWFRRARLGFFIHWGPIRCPHGGAEG
ncbi:alpha-L-fucosidase [Tessaracoccus coleopterorum]